MATSVKINNNTTAVAKPTILSSQIVATQNGGTVIIVTKKEIVTTQIKMNKNDVNIVDVTPLTASGLALQKNLNFGSTGRTVVPPVVQGILYKYKNGKTISGKLYDCPINGPKDGTGLFCNDSGDCGTVKCSDVKTI